MSSVSALEALPPEIRRHLLAMMEFDEIKALVHASLVYHQQYLLDRRWLLCRCLDNTLRRVNIEVILVWQSGSASFAETRDRTAVSAILETYQERRKLQFTTTDDVALTLNDIVGIMVFHNTVIVPVANRYTNWVLENLAQETKGSTDFDPLSKSEETRVIRALYRFQLWCNLCGLGPYRKLQPYRSEYGSTELLKMLGSCFEPWEIEEIVCVYQFSEAKYQHVLDQISWDVNEKNPKFEDQRPRTPEGSFDLKSDDSILVGAISQGLELLHDVLFRITDHTALVSFMQANLKPFPGWFLADDVLGWAAQTERREIEPSEEDLKEARRDPLPSQPAGVPDPDSLYPPFAWSFIWGGTHSNITGRWLTMYMGSNGLQHWGYVMWDQERLEKLGAVEVLTRQMKDAWRGEDPRDPAYL
ncbi:unnamed protein product [Penicillium olsonii]|nr:unnamed protein product [Penicillium olsonii]